MRWAGLAWTLLAAGVVTSHAMGQKPKWAFIDSECQGNGARFERRLAELLDAPQRERLSGSLRVTRQGGVLAVELSIELDGRPLGSRRFETTSCARAAETAAVAAALAVYNGREQPSASQHGGADDIWTRGPEPAPEPASPPASKRSPAPAPRVLEPRAGAFGMAELGALPTLAWGAGVETELGLTPRWSLGVLAAMTVGQARPQQGSTTVRLSEMWLAGRACAAPWLGERHRLDGCAGLRLLRLSGTGEGFDANYSASLSALAPSLGGALTLRAPRRVEWRWELDVATPLSRRRFLVDGAEVARAAAVVGTLRLGALVRF